MRILELSHATLYLQTHDTVVLKYVVKQSDGRPTELEAAIFFDGTKLIFKDAEVDKHKLLRKMLETKTASPSMVDHDQMKKMLERDTSKVVSVPCPCCQKPQEYFIPMYNGEIGADGSPREELYSCPTCGGVVRYKAKVESVGGELQGSTVLEKVEGEWKLSGPHGARDGIYTFVEKKV